MLECTVCFSRAVLQEGFLTGLNMLSRGKEGVSPGEQGSHSFCLWPPRFEAGCFWKREKGGRGGSWMCWEAPGQLCSVALVASAELGQSELQCVGLLDGLQDCSEWRNLVLHTNTHTDTQGYCFRGLGLGLCRELEQTRAWWRKSGFIGLRVRATTLFFRNTGCLFIHLECFSYQV